MTNLKNLKKFEIFCKKHLHSVRSCAILYLAVERYAQHGFSKVGVYYGEGPPVPIPNTVVKLIRAEDTWLEAARENRSMPTFSKVVPQ